MNKQEEEQAVMSLRKDEEQRNENNKQEEVAMLLVSKNSCVIQRIYLHEHLPLNENDDKNIYVKEQTLIVGRHPDCHIVVDHPSISRWHLQLVLCNSSQQLLLTDLSSVHGTWVCGERVTPQVPVILRPNDTFKMGASSRVYRLFWVPYSSAHLISDEELPVHTGLEGKNPSQEEKVALEARALSCRVSENKGQCNATGFEKESFSLSKDCLDVYCGLPKTSRVEPSMPCIEPSAPPAPVSQLWTRRHKGFDLIHLETSCVQLREQDVESSLPKQIGDSAPILNSEAGKYGTLKENVNDSEPKIANNFYNSPATSSVANRDKDEHNMALQDSENVYLQKPLPSGSFEGSSGTACNEHHDECHSSDKEDVDLQNIQSDLAESTFKSAKSENHAMSSRNFNGRKFTTCKDPLSVLSPACDYYPSDKENLTPAQDRGKSFQKKAEKSGKSEQSQRKGGRNLNRAPFQSVPRVGSNSISASRCRSPICPLENSVKNLESYHGTYCSEVPKINQSTVQNAVGSKTKWFMVPDCDSLTNITSLGALKKLEGVRGTQLIIPRIVIRELDCMKRGHVSRNRNAAQESLKWIGDCMVKCSWWIHVQSSSEHLAMGIAATPPASPSSRYNHIKDSNAAATTLSSPSSHRYGNLAEVLSPTAQDHILNCALLFEKLKRDGNIVLISNDVALKVSAMAESVTCESAEEFCDSLTQPYSERFLWAQSTARGHHWVYNLAKDGITTTTYVGRMRRRDGEHNKKNIEVAKGLKLVLLHNSTYGETLKN